MKPASYPSAASSVMSPNMTLGHLLTTPNVMRCEKCRFTTTDIADFKKHMAREHIEYYCFYCNSVSLSEAELQAHLKIHTASSPFKCPHCGQVYMRRMCLIKHIERFHSKIIPQGSKIDSTKNPYISVSSASQSVPSTADASSQRPAVRVTVPTPSVAGFRLDADFQRLKSLNSYLPNAIHGDGTPSNGHVQRNRALTVSLPEEVSIPAGCMVEVAEVKTVDGTKELRLRFVSHQEKESVIKNGRATVPETSKAVPSHLIYQNRGSESEMLTINNKILETKIANKEHPTLAPVNVSKCLSNPSVKEPSRSTKRPSPEVINLVPDVPSKVSRNFISVGDSKVATHLDPINNNVTPSAIASVFASRIMTGVQPENLSTRICPRRVEERSIQERPSCSSSIMPNSVQSTPHIIPTNRASITMRPSEGTLLQTKKQESAKPQQQCSKSQFIPLLPSVIASHQVRVSNECKDNFSPKTFFPQQDSSQKTSTELLPAKKPTKTSKTHMKLSALPQEVKVEKTATVNVRPEREGLPVISSVYSLSRQPDDPRESSQPIVMAEWTNSSGRDSLAIKNVRSEQLKIASGHQAHTDTQDGKSQSILPNNVTHESVKVEPDQRIQHSGSQPPNSVQVKNEKSTPAKEKKKCKNINKALLVKLAHDNSVIQKPSLASEDSSQNPVAANNITDTPAKFLTVSLKRVQFGIWKKSKKKGKAVVSKPRSSDFFDGLRDCNVLQLMPLRKKQAVKCPTPNQPVVVLNHPKPNIHLNTITNTCTNSHAWDASKCQILKMKLSKVTGQSYKVMGCIVQNFI